MPHDLFDTWDNFITYLRVVLGAVSLLVMAFFEIVSVEGRLVTVPAVLVLSFLLSRDVRTIRRRRSLRRIAGTD
jgi:hypothetical protein